MTTLHANSMIEIVFAKRKLTKSLLQYEAEAVGSYKRRIENNGRNYKHK